MGSILGHSGCWSCFSQTRIEIVHTANDNAIKSAMRNIAHASTQYYIVQSIIYLHKLCHQNYYRNIENNQSIIYVNNPVKKLDGR